MTRLIRRAQPWLGTLVEIAVPENCGAEMLPAFEAIRRVHDRMSFHAEGSDLDRIHCAPVGSIVRIDPATVTVLRAALALHAQSGGLFDVTIAPQLIRSGFLPYRYNIHLDTLDGTSADIDIPSDTEIVCHKRVLIDLGGIAKGFAVDAAIATLLKFGVPHGIVNAGGDLRVFGDVPQDIHIRHPHGGFEAAILLHNEAMAVSCNVNQRRGRHTPHIGRHRQCMQSEKTITVRAPACMTADAMTKIALCDEALAARLLRPYHGTVMSFSHLPEASAA
jgi:FAD:protein FMN transferase